MPSRRASWRWCSCYWPWLFPGLTLAYAGAQQFGSWTAVAVPFGLGRILVAHILASLPMGMWIAWRTHRLGETRWLAIAATIVGVLLAGVSLLIAQPLANWSVGGTTVRSFMVRSLWVLVLQLPWCFAAVLTLKKTQRQTVPFWADIITALLLMAIPAVYTLEVVRRQSKLVEDAVINQQYQKALEITNQLYVLRTPEIAGENSVRLLTDLSAEVRLLAKEVQRPLPRRPDHRSSIDASPTTVWPRRVRRDATGTRHSSSNRSARELSFGARARSARKLDGSGGSIPSDHPDDRFGQRRSTIHAAGKFNLAKFVRATRQ